MTDAPERIWAFDYDLENHDGTSVNVLVWDQNRPWPFKATEYIRADLSQAAVEALEAKLAKVNIALNYFFLRDPDKSTSWEYNRDQAEKLARSVLEPDQYLTGGKDD